MWFFNNKKISSIKRNFDPPYLKDETSQKEFEEDGYTIIKNVITDAEIQEAYEFFNQLRTMEGFKVQEKFESSGNFPSKEIQVFVCSFLQNYMKKIAPRIALLDNCEIGQGGALFIKPNTPESILHPHQDSAVIDESKHYAMFVWIPLLDITLENGPLYTLPKSHIWGNYYRSQHIPWAFRHQSKQLWEKMSPILVNKGDVICFDSSIIHASSINQSDGFRIVVCGALLPKGYKYVEFLFKKKTIYKYIVDEDYWMDGGQEASLKNYNYESCEYAFPNPISKKNINQLLNESTS